MLLETVALGAAVGLVVAREVGKLVGAMGAIGLSPAATGVLVAVGLAVGHTQLQARVGLAVASGLSPAVMGTSTVAAVVGAFVGTTSTVGFEVATGTAVLFVTLLRVSLKVRARARTSFGHTQGGHVGPTMLPMPADTIPGTASPAEGGRVGPIGRLVGTTAIVGFAVGFAVLLVTLPVVKLVILRRVSVRGTCSPATRAPNNVNTASFMVTRILICWGSRGKERNS
jgi:hypothetical protein